ncbi:ornithine cyclodeaminase family protein [Ramlibacter ginsenosidimutans]|uniref:Ornithine cyclodeaminase family protein n=1 Tax=Ramlibacter ginsenosidimutans TaxID=502333 RepID=A0A934TR92_9BURK|nr:ornithine cyclodeaminase family protein [Ramlibacter ginsenosidimutans]MBK6006056.1 ornithine cyclodeaminase family protein [Ramlibacter ginsenosidimutans]
MLHITDAMIDAVLGPADAQSALLDALRSFGEGRGAMQERIRTEAGGVKISTMGAVLPDQGYAGAKVYTTIKGQFDFVIQLFSTHTGRPLASLEANAITRLRTAACSVIAARHLARPDVRRLAVFGAGVQGRAHAQQFARAYPLGEIRIVDPFAAPDTAGQLQAQCGVRVRMTDAAAAVDNADIVVTASRSTTPLFDGAALSAGCFVAAIGSSLPTTRELDDTALRRASRIVLDWAPQTLREAGDLMQAAAGCIAPEKLADLAEVVCGRKPGRQHADEITIYKAVGVGLQDIALAGLAYERIAAAR